VEVASRGATFAGIEFDPMRVYRMPHFTVCANPLITMEMSVH
jgi:hypothetical protein